MAKDTKKNTKKSVYKVFHGWAFAEYVTEFTTLKKAMAFIYSQEEPDEWCWEKCKA